MFKANNIKIINYLNKVVRYILEFTISKKKLLLDKKYHKTDSETNSYIYTILKIIKNQKKFENFKRDYFYRKILEHVSMQQGYEYLKILETRNDDILNKAIKTALKFDYLGNPKKYNYNGYNFPFSPSTLRYVKIASDLKNLFGPKIGNIAEIGCGYGGQALVNDQLLEIFFVKLFDIPLVNKLIERYLNSHYLRGAYKTTTINNEVSSNYDLVISNYAFSEMPKALQKIYIDKVISKSKAGYMIMNSGFLKNKRSIGKFSIEELVDLLPKFEILEEQPLSGKGNYLIVWGHDKKKINNYFKIKKIEY